MRRWIEEHNKGVETQGIRWLLKELAPGKTASSLVIYIRSVEEVRKLRMGRRQVRTTTYEWKRPSDKAPGRHGEN